jgi:hypothetical protein
VASTPSGLRANGSTHTAAGDTTPHALDRPIREEPTAAPALTARMFDVAADAVSRFLDRTTDRTVETS